VPPNYDSMIAKLIVWGETRDEAIERMKRALNELVIEGIPTSAGLHKRIMSNVQFQRGNVTTAFLDDYFMR
jgi:biotin carboxylase